MRPMAGVKPYVLVRGRLEALATRALTYDLIDLAAEEPGNDDHLCAGIWSGGVFFPIGAALGR